MICTLLSLTSLLLSLTTTPLHFASATSLGKPSDLQLLSRVQSIQKWAQEKLEENGWELEPSEYPYWNFFPEYQLSLLPDGSKKTWSSPCYGRNEGSAKLSADGSVIEVTVTSTKPTSTEFCTEEYILITANIFSINHVVSPKSTWELNIPVDHTEAEDWDLSTKGVRVFRLLTSTRTALSNIISTVELFQPLTTVAVDPKYAEMNAQFMNDYAHFKMEKFDTPLFNPPDAKDVKSGDAFLILRLDGLNTMLAWAMGSTTGHVTTALWMDGELFIVESEGEVSYWPDHGVLKTPYEQWLQQARDANDNVVWVKLNDEARANYNETAAIEYFKTVQGLEYGYWTQIWGWLDTAEDNFPCLPSDYTNCASWALFEPVLSLVDRIAPLEADMLWNDGLNKRLGTEGLRTAEIYMEAANRGMQSTELYQIVEQDTWRYNMTTNTGEPVEGKSMVCCVFVCSMWKSAGVFGSLADDVNCEEFTNYDDYALTYVQETYTQIIGDYSLNLNDYRTREPYAHMAEHCGSKAPDYEKEPGC